MSMRMQSIPKIGSFDCPDSFALSVDALLDHRLPPNPPFLPMDPPILPLRLAPVEGIQGPDVASMILSLHFLALLHNSSASEFGGPPMHQSFFPLPLHLPILVGESPNAMRHSFFGLSFIKAAHLGSIVLPIFPLYLVGDPLHLQVEVGSEVAHLDFELSDPVAELVRTGFFVRAARIG